IAFPGPYDRGELSRVFAALDLLVVPSLWYENTPFVVLEAFAAGLPDLPDVWGAAHWIAEDPSRLEPLLVPALLIALVGALESLLSAVAVDTQTGRRHASNREVIGQGLGNIVVAFTSSIAGGGSPSRSLASIRCGGDSRRAGVFQGLFVGLIALFAGPGLNSLPLAALAGVLVVYALDMVDGRTRRLFRQGPGRGWASPSSVAVDMAVIYGVALLTVTVDLVAAVAVGFSVSAIRFIARAGSRPIHRLTRGDVIRSKQVRHPGDRKRLDRDGKQILFAELQGPVFFGATDNLLRSLEPELAGTRWLILDMRRVDEIDATGVQILDRIRSRLGDLGGITVLSSLGEGHPAWRFLTDCGAVGTKEGPTVFKDGDTALAWAETALLADGGEDTATELPLSAMDMLVSLDPAEIDILAALMERRVLDSGSALARKGEPASHMFFIALGTVSVRDSNGIRLAGIGPGLTVGEMALLTSGIRSADVIADRHLVAWTLGKPAFEALVSDHPRLAAKLLKAIAAEQSERLRQTSEEVVALLQ
ncbi:MAG: SulP family inorganic anion transporter, partial [Rhodospirillales bacterium]